MKRFLAFLLAITCLSTIIFASPVSAESPTTAYVSDAGDDANDGLTAETPKKTLQKAYNVLNGGNASTADTTGTIVVVGTCTWTTYLLPKGSVTIKGNDENAMLVLDKAGDIALNGDLIIDDIKLKNGTFRWLELNANGNRLEITESVTCVPADPTQPNDKNSYLAINGGYKKSISTGIHLILNGGIFGDVEGAYYSTDIVTGDSEIVIGAGVRVIRNLTGARQGKIDNLDITIEDGAQIGNLNLNVSTATYTGNLTVNVHGNVTISSYTASANKIAEGKTFTADFEYFKNCPDELEAAVTNAGFKLIPHIDLAPIFVGTQEANTGDTDSIRFSAVIDTLAYKAVGFNITATYAGGSKTFNLPCTKVYTELVSVSDETTVEVRAADYGASYIYALVINGVPQSLGEITFTVTPYAEKGGQTIEGNTYTVVYNAGEFVSCTFVPAVAE